MTVKGNIGKGMMALLAAVAVLAGCCKTAIEEPIDNDWQLLTGDKPLRFASAVQEEKGTKAPITDGSLPSGASFGVFAYYQPGTIGGTSGTWSDSKTPNIMKNQAVAFDGTDYNYSPLRYWPANEENTISFWAYYPYNSEVTTTTGVPSVRFTADGETDFMTTDLHEDLYYDACAGIVPLVFKHRLVYVSFKVVSPESGVTLESMKLTGIRNAGTYNHTTGWVLDDASTADYPVVVSSDIPLSSDPVSISKSLCLVPQTFVADGQKLEVTYSKDGGAPVTKTIGLNAAGQPIWGPNDHIVYTINVLHGTITQDGWTDSSHYVGVMADLPQVTIHFGSVSNKNISDLGDNVTFTSVNNNVATVQKVGGKWKIVPRGVGEAKITMTVTDPDGLFAPASFTQTITVAPSWWKVLNLTVAYGDDYVISDGNDQYIMGTSGIRSGGIFGATRKYYVMEPVALSPTPMFEGKYFTADHSSNSFVFGAGSAGRFSIRRGSDNYLYPRGHDILNILGFVWQETNDNDGLYLKDGDPPSNRTKDCWKLKGDGANISFQAYTSNRESGKYINYNSSNQYFDNNGGSSDYNHLWKKCDSIDDIVTNCRYDATNWPSVTP